MEQVALGHQEEPIVAGQRRNRLGHVGQQLDRMIEFCRSRDVDVRGTDALQGPAGVAGQL